MYFFNYCWWFRNPIPNHLGCIPNPVNNGIFIISTGDRRISEPSTVWQPFLGPSLSLQLYAFLQCISEGAAYESKQWAMVETPPALWFLNHPKYMWCSKKSENMRHPKTPARWWIQILFMFTPIWGRFPIWRSYFSDGLVQPRTSWLFLWPFLEAFHSSKFANLLSIVGLYALVSLAGMKGG